MFLVNYSQKHSTVASSTSWDALLHEAVNEIQDLSLKPLVLQRFGGSEQRLGTLRIKPRTWVHLAVLSVTGEEEDLMGDKLMDALDFHKSVSGPASAHLHLLLDNTYRTPWLAAKLLSTNKDLARASAKELLKHLNTTKPENKSAFESYL